LSSRSGIPRCRRSIAGYSHEGLDKLSAKVTASPEMYLMFFRGNIS